MKFHRKEVEQYLEREPRARERSAKDRALVNILLARYPGVALGIHWDFYSKEALIALVQDYNSMDRSWRKILEERPDLRGKDYDSKDELEKEAQRELGYNVPE